MKKSQRIIAAGIVLASVGGFLFVQNMKSAETRSEVEVVEVVPAPSERTDVVPSTPRKVTKTPAIIQAPPQAIQTKPIEHNATPFEEEFSNTIKPQNLPHSIPLSTVEVEPNKLKLKMVVIDAVDESVIDRTGIEEILADNGQLFEMDMPVMHTATRDAKVDFDFMGQKLKGFVSRQHDEDDMQFTKIQLGNLYEFMKVKTVDGITTGTIHTKDGSYKYEYNGTTGFIISLDEYLELLSAIKGPGAYK